MKHLLLVFCGILFSIGILWGQKAQLKGKVQDAENKEPMPYANITLISKSDSTLLLGGMTDDNGKFLIKDIPTGTYLVKISFIGYQSIVIPKLQLGRGTRDMGITQLKMLSENLGEVVIKASQSPISYRVDRKVINAGSFPEANTAMDLLENVPSLQVDFNGKLSYRGSEGFKVYINGHPVQNGEEKLRSLSAAQIEKIEVIANPSAKYDAEGTAGIIQVILKKNKLEGYAINASASIDTKQEYGINFSVDKKGKKGGWHTNGSIFNYRYTKFESTSIYENTSTGSLFRSTEVSQLNKNTVFVDYINLGFNYDITPKDFIDFSINIDPLKKRQKSRMRSLLTEEGFDLGAVTNKEEYELKSLYDISYQYLTGAMKYSHAFTKDHSHELSLLLDYTFLLGDCPDEQMDTQTADNFSQTKGYKTQESNEIMFSAKLNYDVPLSENSSLSVGSQIETDHIPNITAESGFYDANGKLTPFAGMRTDQSLDFIENVYAGFALFKSKWKKFEYQLGLRLEHTYRKANYTYTERNKIQTDPFETNFTDWFPTVHLLYNINDNQQLTANYSRRISRPNYWDVVPLITYSDVRYFRSGNSRIKPTYTDSYEIGYKKSWDKDFISVELFTKNSRDLRLVYNRTYKDNMLMAKPENIGTSWATGIEFMTGVDVFTWWNLNFSNSFYHYTQKTNVDNKQRNYSSLVNNTRINNTFRLPKGFTLKWSGAYVAPDKSLQVNSEGYFYSNFAIKKSFKDGLWILTATATNIFDSYRYTIEQEGLGFTLNSDNRSLPYFGFKVAYNFNNQK